MPDDPQVAPSVGVTATCVLAEVIAVLVLIDPVLALPLAPLVLRAGAQLQAVPVGTARQLAKSLATLSEE